MSATTLLAPVDVSQAGELSFVGRETPLGALVSAVQAAELGESVHGLVAGEPGIGKTRLVRTGIWCSYRPEPP